jgi:ABC-type multidrug transport system fused ATPase/permease subunit
MVGFVLGFVFLVAALVIIGLYIATFFKLIIFVVHVIVYIFSAGRINLYRFMKEQEAIRVAEKKFRDQDLVNQVAQAAARGERLTKISAPPEAAETSVPRTRLTTVWDQSMGPMVPMQEGVVERAVNWGAVVIAVLVLGLMLFGGYRLGNGPSNQPPVEAPTVEEPPNRRLSI